MKTIWQTLVVVTLMAAWMVGRAQAAPVVVDPWNSSGNGNVTGDNFGTAPNLDILYRAKNGWGSAPATDQLRVWALGFSDLQGISYNSDTYGDVAVMPDSGWTQGVSLFSFDLGVYDYATQARNVEVQIWSGDYTTLLKSKTVNIGASHYSFEANLFSLNGLHIQFGPYPGYVGIDNITVEAGNTVIPEPAVFMLYLTGMGVSVFGLRRTNGVRA